jgi:hypothetical protein
MRHWRLQKNPSGSISLHDEVPDGASNWGQSSGELDWPEGAKTGAPERLTPNWTLPDQFPQLNFMVGNLSSSVHADHGRWGQLHAFLVTSGFPVHLGGLASITDVWECLNKGAEGRSWPELGWPRRGVFYSGGNRIGGNPKLRLTGDRLRTILGGWVRDDPTELTAGSIYTKWKRWPRIWATTHDGRRSKSLLARN